MGLRDRLKSSYASVWLLLLAAFVVIFTLSCFDNPPSIFGYDLKSSGMADYLTRQPEPEPEPMPAVPTDSAAAADVAPTPAQTDTTAQTLLFIGDSMLDGLSPRLAAYARASGHKLYSVTWYSSSTEAWARSGKLKKYIEQIKPTFIFICLGSNELNIKDIRTKRAGYVKQLTAEIGSIPYLWIGPPNWKKDTGINELIHTYSAPGSYFKSDGMTFERRKDGAHPTAASAIEWMDSVVRWIPAHAAHPIRLDTPLKRTDRPTKLFVHSPEEI